VSVSLVSPFYWLVGCMFLHCLLTYASLFLSLLKGRPPRPPRFPYTTLFRSPWSTWVRPSACRSTRTTPPASTVLVELSLLICTRSEEHTSELQSREKIVCRLLLAEKKTSEPQAREHPVCRLLRDQ